MHTYANVGELQDYMRDNGSTDLGNANARTLLSFLEAASRRVDSYCDRSSALGSASWTGFGPRIGTNLYDAAGELTLRLGDDLLSTSSLSRASGTGLTGTSLVADTDYYLQPYGGPPYSSVQLVATNAIGYSGYRLWSVTGTWCGPGCTTDLADATVSSGLSLDATVRTFITSSSPDIQPGDTLLIGSEQLYVRAMDGTTVSVLRGANGTTAATHVDASAISTYSYHPSVVDATLQIAMRRMRTAHAGLSGSYGGGQMPDVVQHDSEWSVLNSTVGDLRHIAI
jgi:hypothetical protein